MRKFEKKNGLHLLEEKAAQPIRMQDFSHKIRPLIILISTIELFESGKFYKTSNKSNLSDVCMSYSSYNLFYNSHLLRNVVSQI